MDLPVGLERFTDIGAGSFPLCRPAQHGQLGQLLVGEGQPRSHLGIQRGLGLEAKRHVQQGARRGHDGLSRELPELPELVQRGLEVVGPDVPSVNHAGEEHLVTQPAGGAEQFEVLGAKAEVESQALHR